MNMRQITSKFIFYLAIFAVTIFIRCDIDEPINYGTPVGYETVRMYDYQYIKNVYFFVDQSYRDNYFPLNHGIHTYDADKIITNFELFYSTGLFHIDADYLFGFASTDMDQLYLDENVESKDFVKGYWKRLEKQKDYQLSEKLGYIKLNKSIDDECMLAVVYRDSSQQCYGDVYFDFATDSIFHLKLIKQKNLSPGDATWDLMFRHIYYLGREHIEYSERFEINIAFHNQYYYDTGINFLESVDVSYIDVFGIQNYYKIYDGPLNLANSELEFPSLCPFDDPTNQFYSQLKAEDKLVSKMYDSNSQEEIFADSKFYIEVRMRK